MPYKEFYIIENFNSNNYTIIISSRWSVMIKNELTHWQYNNFKSFHRGVVFEK